MSLSLSRYLDPPPRRTAHEDHPTLLATYWISGVCLVVILFRVAGRYVRIIRLYSDDRLMLLTLIPLAVRLAFVHVVLLYGTNNLPLSAVLSPTELARRQTGSGMVLGARVAHLAFIWSQKLTISEFYERLTTHLYERRYRIGLKLIRYALYATFSATLLTIFLSCHPPSLLTTVSPAPPPECRVAFAPLYTECVLSVLTDLLLVLAPLPAILRSSLPALKKARLTFSFSLALACIAVTTYRTYSTTLSHGSQQHRTLWASLEELTATVVGNGIVIHTFARDRGEKRLKFHHLSPPDVAGVHRSPAPKVSEDDLDGLYASTVRWSRDHHDSAPRKPKAAAMLRDVGGLLQDLDPPGMRPLSMVEGVELGEFVGLAR